MAKHSKRTRRVSWLTDIHLEFLDTAQIDAFLVTVAADDPDVLLITGDITTPKVLANVLTYIARRLLTPVYFVLGNHDYYGARIADVRTSMRDLTGQGQGVAWMPAAGLVELAPDTALVGHGGWSDGRYGDFMRSQIILNDYLHIEDLAGLPKPDLLNRLQQLADGAGDYLRGMLEVAAGRYPNITVMTHSPPFQEACWFQGKTPEWDNPYLPHFTCKAVGDALLATAERYPTVQLTVLCGHVHHAGTVSMRQNLHVITGGAEYEKPHVQQVFEFAL